MKYFVLPFCLLMLLLSACEREDRFGFGLPVIFQIDQLLLRGGDTITITGNNFSENAANNLVTFNGIQALIVSSSFRDLVVVVPERAGAGRLVVSTRAGRSNEFPYRYNYQVSEVKTLELGIGESIRRMKIINNQIFLISAVVNNRTAPSPYTKIYRFRLDGSAVVGVPNPLEVTNYSVGAIARNALGDFVVSARNVLSPPPSLSAAQLYALDLAQGTLSPLPGVDDVLGADEESNPDVGSFSDITFDNQGNLYYVNLNIGSLMKRSPTGVESVVLFGFGAFLSDIHINNQGEAIVAIPNPLIASVGSQGSIKLLLQPNDFLGFGQVSMAFNERNDDLFIAFGSRILIFDRASQRLENLAVIPQNIQNLALSEDGRLFALTNSSRVIEIVYK